MIVILEDVVCYGVDVFVVVILVCGNIEGEYICWLIDIVNVVVCFEMLVIVYVYLCDFFDGGKIVFIFDEIVYVVCIGYEMGVDVIKVGYIGDFDLFCEMVVICLVFVVIVGGLKIKDFLGVLM